MVSENILVLAQSIVTWLTPFFPYLLKGVKLAGAKWFESLGEKGGEEAVKKAASVWDKIKSESTDNKSIEGAALILCENPENREVQQIFVRSLVEVFQKHPELLQDVEFFQKNSPTPPDQRSGGVYFSGSGKVEIKGDVVGHNQTKTQK